MSMFRITVLGLCLSAIIFVPIIGQIAFSDGLFEENLPGATVGDRDLSLYTKISPPILTSESKEKSFFQLRLYDAKTGNNIQNVNYFVAVTKGDKLLMRELFYSKDGPLTIKITPKEGPLTVFGSTEPFLGGWMSDTGEISIQGPILLQGGLYHFAIEIFGIDNTRNIFNPDVAPRFDSYLSVGDIFYQNITYNLKTYNTTLISYYDKIKNFTFNAKDLQVSWSMPFDWNVSRIKANNIFVHEEIKIPKEFVQFSGSPSFNGTVNGQPLVGRSLAIDPFSSDKALIIHFLINKNDIIKLAENGKVTNFNKNNMEFTLKPLQEARKTSSDIVTDTGAIRASLSWDPLQPTSADQNKLNINFTDALKDTPLNSDVNYNIYIKSANGQEIFRKENLVAKNSTSAQIIDFPSKDTYQIEIDVKSLKFSDQPSPDKTRKGIARGFVVVT